VPIYIYSTEAESLAFCTWELSFFRFGEPKSE
jgi:hypothetical protein